MAGSKTLREQIQENMNKIGQISNGQELGPVINSILKPIESEFQRLEDHITELEKALQNVNPGWSGLYWEVLPKN